MTDPQTLAEMVHDARQRTMDLVADLSDDQLIGPLLPGVNPLLWEIGHLSWFQEIFVLRGVCGEEPIHDFADAIWDSGAIPHDTRWRLELPSRQETLAYMREVRDRVTARVLDPASSDVLRYFVLYSVFHEDVHTEAFTYTRQTLGYPPPKLPSLSGDDGAPDPHGQGPHTGDVEIPGGNFLLGATRGQPFAYDNERWGHRVAVEPFALARAPVTQGEFAAFVDDGGYQRPELWSTAGAGWLAETGVEHPLYWARGEDGGWQRRHFDQWVVLEEHKPVSYVSWHEAHAYCNWAGRRLPTEAEWEFAAAGQTTTPGATPAQKRRYPWGDHHPAAEEANLDWQAMDAVDVGAHAPGDSPFGPRQLIGNVWEWTASVFQPYPNFEPDAYRANSEQFFGHRMVLRGGSWATRARYIRNTLRNYFPPGRRDILAGFRTAAPAETRPR
jgi:iron(II)-dependent oxidoreductase